MVVFTGVPKLGPPEGKEIITTEYKKKQINIFITAIRKCILTQQMKILNRL